MIATILISLLLFWQTPICPTDIVPCVSPNPPKITAPIYLPMVYGP